MDGTVDWLKDATTLLVAIEVTLLSVAAAVALVVGLHRCRKRSRQTQVTIGKLVAATGNEAMTAASDGLTHRIREEVADFLYLVQGRTKAAVETAASDPSSPFRALDLDDIDRQKAVLGDIASSTKQLAESLGSMVPQPAQGAYRVVVGSLLRPKEIRALGVLQQRNEGSGGVGLSFDVEQVGVEEVASRITVWEDGDCELGDKTVVDRCHDLVVPAARALALELLRQRLKATMSAGRRDPKVDPEALVELLVGSLYHSGAHRSAPATKSFYELAERSLRKSTRTLEHYMLSYQLANTLAELARRQRPDEGKLMDLLLESNTLLDQAQKQLPDAGLEEAQGAAEKLRIQAARATNACLLAEHLLDDEAAAQVAAGLACQLTQLDPAEYESDGVLYNVACALAVAARVTALARHGAETEICLERSKVWLLHACRRQDLWWRSAQSDLDLRLLTEWMPGARRWLAEISAEVTRRSSPEAEAVTMAVDKVLEALRPSAAAV